MNKGIKTASWNWNILQLSLMAKLKINCSISERFENNSCAIFIFLCLTFSNFHFTWSNLVFLRCSFVIVCTFGNFYIKFYRNLTRMIFFFSYFFRNLVTFMSIFMIFTKSSSVMFDHLLYLLEVFLSFLVVFTG